MRSVEKNTAGNVGQQGTNAENVVTYTIKITKANSSALGEKLAALVNKESAWGMWPSTTNPLKPNRTPLVTRVVVLANKESTRQMLAWVSTINSYEGQLFSFGSTVQFAALANEESTWGMLLLAVKSITVLFWQHLWQRWSTRNQCG